LRFRVRRRGVGELVLEVGVTSSISLVNSSDKSEGTSEIGVDERETNCSAMWSVWCRRYSGRWVMNSNNPLADLKGKRRLNRRKSDTPTGSYQRPATYAKLHQAAPRWQPSWPAVRLVYLHSLHTSAHCYTHRPLTLVLPFARITAHEQHRRVRGHHDQLWGCGPGNRKYLP